MNSTDRSNQSGGCANRYSRYHHAAMKSTRFEKIAALLEMTASQLPELIGVQIEALNSQWHGLPIYDLASAFQSRPESIGRTALKACQDLDQLEKTKKDWQDPRQILDAPNLAALQVFCEARISRVPGLAHRRRLAVVRRKLAKAQEMARVRGLIEDFIGVDPKISHASTTGRYIERGNGHTQAQQRPRRLPLDRWEPNHKARANRARS